MVKVKSLWLPEDLFDYTIAAFAANLMIFTVDSFCPTVAMAVSFAPTTIRHSHISKNG